MHRVGGIRKPSLRAALWHGLAGARCLRRLKGCGVVAPQVSGSRVSPSASVILRCTGVLAERQALRPYA